MLELQREGVPLERDEEANQVYWSVPHAWGPTGVFVPASDIDPLLRMLVRHPKSAVRDGVISRLLAALPQPELWRRLLDVVLAGHTSAENGFIDLVEDAAAQQSTLHARYYSSHRGKIEWRWLSVQRIVLPERFVAWCHKAERLKWFRLDRVLDARFDSGVAYHPDPTTEAFIEASVDGFAGQEPIREHRFWLRTPDDRWVVPNLPFEAVASETDPERGTMVAVRSHAVLAIARFVAGLGGVARVETPELREVVLLLAREVLQTNASEFDLHKRSGAAIDGTD